MLQTLTGRLSMAAAILAVGTATASGAVLTRTFTINTADIVDLYSATYDGALIPCTTPTPPDAQECTFFNGYLPAARNIVITPTGTGSGTISVNYDSITGEILQVNTLYIALPTLKLVIQGTTTVNVIPGNNNPVPSPGDVAFIEAGTGTLGRDLDGIYAQTILGQGTADPDQAPAIGQAAIFQHNDQPNVDAPDFAVFTDVVETGVPDGCTGPACGLITSGLLSLDGVRYRLEGTISCKAAGNSLILKTQTANNSIYRVNFTAVTTESDCDLDTVANAGDNCPDEPNVGQADTDLPSGDGRGNVCDNCRSVANNGPGNNGNPFQGAQADSDGDGFGNRCDGDMNNNGSTNAFDTPLYRAQIGQASVPPLYNKADINTSGGVNAFDTPLYRALIGTAPGPGAGP